MADNIFDSLDDAAPESASPLPVPSLGERFRLNFEAGQRFNTIVGAAAGTTSADRVVERLQFEQDYLRTPGWQTWGEGAAALAGQIAGTAASPENFLPVGLGEKLVVGTKMAATGLWARVFAGAVDAAAVNAATDLAIQGVEMGGGVRDGFDAHRYFSGILLGAGIGGAAGAAGHGIAKAFKGGKAAATAAEAAPANPFDALDQQAPAATPEPAAPVAKPAPEPVPSEAAPAAELAAPAPAKPAEAAAPVAEPVATASDQAVPVKPAEIVPDPATVKPAEASPPAELPALGEALAAKAAEARGMRAAEIEAEQAADAAHAAKSAAEYTARQKRLAEAKASAEAGIDEYVRVLNRHVSEANAEALDTDLADRAWIETAKPGDRAPSGTNQFWLMHRNKGESDKAFLARWRAERSAELDRAIDARRNAKPLTADDPSVRSAFELHGGKLAAEPAGFGMIVRAGGELEFLDMASPRLAAAPGQRSRAAAGVAGASADRIARVRETGEALAKALDVAATRQGRMSGKASKLGQYGVNTGVTRLRSLDDFDTLTHEYGHAFEANSTAAKTFVKRHAGLLKPLDYDPAKGRAQEGFAEFVRLWVTNRAYALKQHPEIAAAFEAMLKTEPEAAKGFDDAAKAWEEFLAAPSSMAVASTIVSARKGGWIARTRQAVADAGVTGTIADTLQRLYTYALDDLGPLNRAVAYLKDLHFANTGKALDIEVTADPYKLARMSRGAWSAGHMDIMYGVAPYKSLNPASPSLRDAIIEATGKPNALSRWDEAKVRDFGAYLWSRRALGEWERFEAGDIPNPPDKLTKGDHAANVAEMEAANPQFASAADKVHEFARALWTKKRDAGLIDLETYEQGLRIRDYVPGVRDFSREAETTGRSGGKGGSAQWGFVKRFKGSKRDVVNPLESLAGDAYETAMAIARNDVAKTLHRLALTAGKGGGAIAEIVPAKEMRASMVDPIEAVENAARAAGLDKPDIVLLRDALESAIGAEKAAIFRPAMINEKGEPIVFFRDGGQLKALRLADGRFGRDMYKALTGMAPAERNFFVEMLALPARAMRFGATTAMEFIGANFVRDQAMATIYYGAPFKRLGRTLQGAADDLLGRPAAIAYNRVGGLSGGQETASLSAAMAKRDISVLKRKGWLAQRFSSWRGFFSLAETSETAARVGLFRTFREEAAKRGLDPYEAAMEAAWRARDYIDFDRRGAATAAVNRIVPFFNVSMQGLDKSVRTMIAPLAKKYLADRPLSAGEARAAGDAMKAWARLSMMTVAGMSLHALMKRHEDYDEISAQTRATHWTVKAGDKWVAIPKPFEMAVFLNLGEAAFDAMVERDPTAWGRWLDSAMIATAPPSLMEGNPALRNWFEVRTNTDLRTGGPIVPDNLQGLEPFLQFTARTSKLARKFGELFGVSPMVAEHVFVSHTASWGRTALSLYDLAQPDAPGFAWDDAPIARRFIKDAAKGATSTAQFWAMVGERQGALTGKARTYQALGAAEREDYYARQDDGTRAFIAADAMAAKAKRLHPLINARNGVQAIGVLRREMASGTLRGPDGEPFQVAAAARTAADDVLSTLAMAMARNALTVTGEPGWANRRPMDEDGFARELAAIDIRLADTLAALYAEKKVWRSDAVAAVWPEYRARLLEEGALAEVSDLRALVEAEGRPLDGDRRPKRPKAKPGG